MNLVVDMCSLTKSEGGLQLIHSVDDDTLQPAENLCNYCTSEMRMKQWK